MVPTKYALSIVYVGKTQEYVSKITINIFTAQVNTYLYVLPQHIHP
jgi:hypothetical protein